MHAGLYCEEFWFPPIDSMTELAATRTNHFKLSFGIWTPSWYFALISDIFLGQYLTLLLVDFMTVLRRVFGNPDSAQRSPGCSNATDF